MEKGWRKRQTKETRLKSVSSKSQKLSSSQSNHLHWWQQQNVRAKWMCSCMITWRNPSHSNTTPCKQCIFSQTYLLKYTSQTVCFGRMLRGDFNHPLSIHRYHCTKYKQTMQKNLSYNSSQNCFAISVRHVFVTTGWTSFRPRYAYCIVWHQAIKTIHFSLTAVWL